MIKKLHNKLMIMFLSFTMITFTVVMVLMISNTVIEVQRSEIEYTNNIADSIIDELQSEQNIKKLDLAIYATKSQCWVSISDGISVHSSPEYLDTSSDVLCNQIYAGKNVISQKGITNEITNRESSRTVHSIKGMNNDNYYGVHSIFDIDNKKSYDVIILCPQSTFWAILQSYCSWYPLLWLGVFVLMYLMSRFLIQKAVHPVEAAMKSQKEFIASASHELKAPLAVIQVNTETLEIDKSNPVSAHKQKIILEECSRMSNLIKSLLSLAASDAGNWKMDMREIDVDTLLIETWEVFTESARKKNIRLDLDFNEHYPKFYCDKERITQVLGILLDNAITYSNPGMSIEMGAKLQTKQIVFFVIDHGCGIPDTKKEKVFERFYSGDPSRTDKSHYGLGLSIAQEIIKLHNGYISLKDTPNGGCTFEIYLPFEKASY